MPASLDLGAVTLTQAQSVAVALGDKVTAASLTDTIVGASTLQITVEDPARKVLPAPVLARRSSVSAGGRQFQLTRVTTAGSALTVEFEDLLVATLRTQKGPLLAKVGVQTRTDFAAGLVAAAGGSLRGQPDELIQGTTLRGRVVSQGQIGRGSSSDDQEDSWTCLTRLAQELDWRCFSDGRQVWFASDAWIKGQRAAALTVTENRDGLGWLSGDYAPNDSSGNDVSFATTAPWMGAPGQGVNVTNPMGPLNGPWMVSEAVRDLTVSTQVTLTRAQGDIPAVPAQSTSLTQATGPNGQVVLGDGPSGPAGAAIVAAATSQLGVRYVYGGASPGGGFDCSGLTQWACARAGIGIARTAAAQFSSLPVVQAGDEQAGDLVFFRESSSSVSAPSHVGVYVGGGRMIDAPHTGSVVRYDTVRTFEVYLGARRP